MRPSAATTSTRSPIRRQGTEQKLPSISTQQSFCTRPTSIAPLPERRTAVDRLQRRRLIVREAQAGASPVMPWTRRSAISRIHLARCASSAAQLAKRWPAIRRISRLPAYWAVDHVCDRVRHFPAASDRPPSPPPRRTVPLCSGCSQAPPRSASSPTPTPEAAASPIRRPASASSPPRFVPSRRICLFRPMALPPLLKRGAILDVARGSVFHVA
jgi:hypothetical protein